MRDFNSYTGDAEQFSYYNESWLKNVRLSKCWDSINEHKRTGNIQKWKEELDIALDELISDAKIIMPPTQYKKIIKENLKKANTNFIQRWKAGDKSQAIYWLRVKDRIIRHIQNLVGRGTKIIKVKDKGRAIAFD